MTWPLRSSVSPSMTVSIVFRGLPATAGRPNPTTRRIEMTTKACAIEDIEHESRDEFRAAYLERLTRLLRAVRIRLHNPFAKRQHQSVDLFA